jgi:hypothetical protein
MVNVHGDRSRPLCVSCCNRHYEVEKGRNAKGGKPEKLKLRTVRLQVIQDGQAKVVTMEKVTSAAEAILTLARQAKSPLQFAYAPMLPPGVPLNPQFTGEDLPEWLQDEEEDDEPPAEVVSRLVCEEVSQDVEVCRDFGIPPPASAMLSASLHVESQIAAKLSAPPRARLPRVPRHYAWLMQCTAFTNRPIEMRAL